MAYSKSTCIGIDIGTMDSIVAYVGKSMVDIVQNEVSQRKTPTMVGFNERERLLGDAAQVVMKSNLKNTVRNFRHIMGPKSMCEDAVAREKFWSLASEGDTEDESVGFAVKYKGEDRIFSATQVMGMYLTKMKETAETWTQSKVTDVVLSVPSYFNDFQRQAMLDASALAGLNCLRLMNEHTATALAYGIYRTKEFDAEKPTVTAFGHMGHSSFSLSIVSFTSDRLNILAEATSLNVGGRAMDEVLMKHFGAEFEKKNGCNPLESKKAMAKLEDACQKCKKILSANDQAPIAVECLMEDCDLSGKITRDEFEALCAPLLKECSETIAKCIKESGVEPKDVDFVEIVGGASRVPWFQKCLSDAFAGKELSRTLNADECIARGCALQAAILSPAYKVRAFNVEDKVPHSVTISWMGSSKDQTDGDKKDGEDTEMKDAEEEKDATLVKKSMEVFSLEKDKMDSKRYITWFRNSPFELGAQYTGSETGIGNYQINLPQQECKKKIKIEARMSIHGIFSVENAQIIDIEEYEETVKEKREIIEEDTEMPDAGAAAAENAEGAANSSGDTKSSTDTEGANNGEGGADKGADNGAEKKEEKKEEEKKEEKKKPKYEWVEVKKPKKRTKRTALEVTCTGKPGIPDALLQKYKDQESTMIRETQEAKENDNRRNDLETYIYAAREKMCTQGGAVYEYMVPADREKFSEALMKGEDWLYDNFDATTLELCDKLEELQNLGNPAQKRFDLRTTITDYTPKFFQTLSEARGAAQNPSEDFAHIAQEKKDGIAAACDQLEAWMQGEMQKMSVKPLHEDITTIKIADIQIKEKELREKVRSIMSEPKPTPPPEPTPTEGEHAAADGAEGETKKNGAKEGAESKDQEEKKEEEASGEAGAQKKEEEKKEDVPAEDTTMQVD